MTPIFPFTPAALPGTWAVIGVIIGLVFGVPLFLGATIGYVVENITGRPPREELDKIER